MKGYFNNKEETDNSINSNNYEFDYRIIDLLNKTKYQDKNIFEINKMIEEIIFYVELCKQKVGLTGGLFYCKNEVYMVNYS